MDRGPSVRLGPLVLLAGLTSLTHVGCAPLLSIPFVQRGVAAVTMDPQPADPSVGTASGGTEYAHWLEPGHPLATGITTAAHGAVDVDGLVAAARTSDVVWIGVEEHNPQAYRLTAKYLRALVRAGATPRLVVAAVPTEAQSQLQTPTRGTVRQRAWALSDSLPWEEYGADDPVIMPGMIEPVFRAALETRLELVAGGYSRSKVRAFTASSASARTTSEAASIGLDVDWHRSRTRALVSALDENICVKAPEALAESRALADRAESGGVAARVMGLLAKRRIGPAVVVITELRHGRTDVGSPHALAALATRSKRTVKQLTIGVQEADWERQEVAQYREELTRHDAVWFTEPIFDDPKASPLAQCAERVAQR